MIFNSNPSKQAQEVIFSRKLKNVSHPPLVFNNANVSSCKSQKHLGILLDSKLTFEEHYKTILNKTNRTILTLTGAIRSTSKEKIYQKLGLDSLQVQRWYRKVCLFYKIKQKSVSFLLI